MSEFSEYEQFDVVGLADLVASRQMKPGDLLAAAVARIEARNPSINAVVHKMYERAERAIDAGLPEGPFTGVPYLLKDLNLRYAGVPLTDGSRSLRHHIPTESAELVERLEGSGLMVLGKTNTPEFGAAPTTEPELHGPTHNPWDLMRTTGGSSGGSAAAVASGMVPAAHASDGGGSIRIPASACGLFGFKPTRGVMPRDEGEGWFGMSIDHALTRSVRDSAALLDATRGPALGAPYAAPAGPSSFRAEAEISPGKLRIAVSTQALLGKEIDAECMRAVRETGRLLEDLGHKVDNVEVPVDKKPWTDAFAALAVVGGATDIRRSVEKAGARRAHYGDYELVNWIAGLVGERMSAMDLAESMRQLRLAGRAMALFFKRYDVLVTSTLGAPPWPLGQLAPTAAEHRALEAIRRAPAKPALMLLFRQLVEKILEPIPNTPLFNMTGQPAMSVPLHWSPSGLPIGIQFVAGFGDDGLLFRLAGQLEEARPWFDRRPPVLVQ